MRKREGSELRRGVCGEESQLTQKGADLSLVGNLPDCDRSDKRPEVETHLLIMIQLERLSLGVVILFVGSHQGVGDVCSVTAQLQVLRARVFLCIGIHADCASTPRASAIVYHYPVTFVK